MTAGAQEMLQRYALAAQFTAPRLATRDHGLIEGYWIDERTFFFRNEYREPSILDAPTGRIERLAGSQDHRATSEEDLSIPALYSPDARYACFVRGHDLWLRDRETHDERALTTDGAPLFAYGQQSETALSAISYRRNPVPVGLWSPDSKWFLTHRIDDRAVPELALIQHAPGGAQRPVLHRYRYAMPGGPLPLATPIAFNPATGGQVAFDDYTVLVSAFSPFSFRRFWFGKGDTAWLLRLDRHCQKAELICLDLGSGRGRIVITETADRGYLDLHPLILGTPNVRTLASTDEAIWFSERDGWGHLYLYDTSTGALKNRITAGEWLVRDIVHVDETNRRVLFLAGGLDPTADPARRCLCAVSLDGSDFEVLLSQDGDVTVSKTEPCGPDQDRVPEGSCARAGISPGGRFAVVRTGNVVKGNRTEILDLLTRERRPFAKETSREHAPRSRHITAMAADGRTQLHGVLFLPSDFSEAHQYPLIDFIYPGPQLLHQPQCSGSSLAAPAMALAQLGFATLMLDTRGTPGRDRAFHQVGYPELLHPQVDDHVAVVRELCSVHRFLDRDRIGILGHSSGGAASARALFDFPELFKAGVAVCGNHDSTSYAAAWSDKYRGAGTAVSWTAQANQAVAHKLERPLLLVSGDLDENVHVGQTLSLADVLIRANREFELLIVPNEGHSILMTHGYTQRRIWDFFVRHLLEETPPRHFELRFEPHELACYGQRSWNEIRQ